MNTHLKLKKNAKNLQIIKKSKIFLKNKNKNPKSVIRIYGVDEHSNSVALFVHNYSVYFYVEIPENVVKTGQEKDFCEKIQKILKSSSKSESELLILTQEKTSIMGYSFGEKVKVLKILFPFYVQASAAKNILLKNNGAVQKYLSYFFNLFVKIKHK